VARLFVTIVLVLSLPGCIAAGDDPTPTSTVDLASALPDLGAAPTIDLQPPTAWIGSAPVTIADGQTRVGGLALDAHYLYWCNWGGQVMRAGLDGTNPTVLADGQPAPTAVAVDDTNVYWTTLGNAGNGSGQVMRMALSGGAPVELAQGENNPVALALDGANLYWLNLGTGDQFGNYAQDGALRGLPKGAAPGTPPTTRSAGLYLPDWGSLRVDPAGLLWTSSSVLQRYRFGDGSTSVLAADPHPWGGGVQGFALYNGLVYFSTGVSLYTVPLEGGEVQDLSVPITGGGASSVAIDDTGIYFVIHNLSSVYWLPPGGRQPFVISNNENWPWAIATTRSAVYWLDKGEGENWDSGAAMMVTK
jgi:hypothetical protein